MGNYEDYTCGAPCETACTRYENRCENRCTNRYARCGSNAVLCSNKVIGFFVVALAAALGLIFGAVYAEQIFAALAAVIVFAAVMVVAIAALLIYRLCDRG
ncbi:MAG: hypothetical protein IJE08_11420 [Clostridia bacterium]|nr:hypothetical protein [Clostridia bacterium]